MPLNFLGLRPNRAELNPIVDFFLKLVLVQQSQRESGLAIDIPRRCDLPDHVLGNAGVLVLPQHLGDLAQRTLEFLCRMAEYRDNGASSIPGSFCRDARLMPGL